MLRSIPSRRALLSVLCAGLLLVGCGGGSSGDEASGPDLYEAYARIQGGMSLEQVLAIVGFESNFNPNVGRTKTEYVWDVNRDTDRWAMLAVGITGSGVVVKSITGYKGMQQQDF